jgi:hypothetical protein
VRTLCLPSALSKFFIPAVLDVRGAAFDAKFVQGRVP